MKNPFSMLPNETRRDIIVTSKILAPLFFLLIAAYVYKDFVVYAVRANLAINGMIVVAASYGVFLILGRLFSAQQDFRVIERFGRQAKEGVYMKQLLEEPWLKRRYVRHYLGHIAQTGGTLASQLDQNAIESELHALTEEYNSRLELPQFLVGFMIAMGLLGTFIGLLTTLTGISGMLDGMGGANANIQEQFAHLVTELRKPLAGMGIAFSASMFGLVTSLMLAIMLTNLRRFISRVISCARNVMHDLTELSRRPSDSTSVVEFSPDDISTIRGAVGMQLTTMSNNDLQGTLLQAQDANLRVANRVETMTKKLDTLFQAFEAHLAGTQKFNDLLGFGPRMKETAERTLEELKLQSLAQVEQQRLSQILIDISGNMVRVSNSILEAQRQTQSDSALSSKNLGEAMRQSSLKTLEELKNHSLGLAEQHRLSQTLIDVSGDMVRVANSILSAQRQNHSDFTIAFKDLDEHVKEAGEKTVEELKSQSVGDTERQRLTQSLLDVGTTLSGTADNVLDMQRKTQADLSLAFRNMIDQLSKVESSNIGGSRHLYDIKESLTKLFTSLDAIELISTGIGQQSLLLETLIAEARTTQKMLGYIQQEIAKLPVAPQSPPSS